MSALAKAQGAVWKAGARNIRSHARLCSAVLFGLLAGGCAGSLLKDPR